MKKIFSIVAIVFVMVSLLACVPTNADEFNDELELKDKKITELEEQLNGQQELLEMLQDELKLMEESKKDLEEQLDNLEGRRVVYSATEPIYGKREGEVAFFSISATENENDKEPFAKFNKYLLNDFSQYGRFMVLMPNDIEDRYPPGSQMRRYSIKVAQDCETPVEPIVNEIIEIYDKHLGDATWPYEKGEELPDGVGGNSRVSIRFETYFGPIPEDQMYIPTIFVYGIKDGVEYVNLYAYRPTGKGYTDNFFCVGTVYFETNCYVSATWLETYIQDHIYIGGNKELAK